MQQMEVRALAKGLRCGLSWLTILFWGQKKCSLVGWTCWAEQSVGLCLVLDSFHRRMGQSSTQEGLCGTREDGGPSRRQGNGLPEERGARTQSPVYGRRWCAEGLVHVALQGSLYGGGGYNRNEVLLTSVLLWSRPCCSAANGESRARNICDVGGKPEGKEWRRMQIE